MPTYDACTLANGLTLELLRAGGTGKTPILCIPGLTRNVRDFSDVVDAFSSPDREVIAVSLRGRSGSDRAHGRLGQSHGGGRLGARPLGMARG